MDRTGTLVKSSTAIGSNTAGLTSLSASEAFAFSLALGGDVNGDGVPDVVVGE
jgi:hypothetical protein